MYGAIIGDIIGSHYEWHSTKKYDFELFNPDCRFTDDTVLSLAVCEAILYNSEPTSFTYQNKRALEYAVRYKQYYSRYPDAGFGNMFITWATSTEMYKQDSYGNGSAMRAVPIGYAYNSLEEVLLQAKLSAQYTHNNSEAIKGAQAVATAVFLARNNNSKEEIKNYIEKKFGYDLSYPLDSIREFYSFNSRTINSVPQAVLCFLESNSYEDAIRKAISLGGDADTQACIAGGIAEAFGYKVPEDVLKRAKSILNVDIKKVVDLFISKFISES